MIVLSATNASLELVTSGTNSTDYAVSWMDLTSTTAVLDGSSQGNIAAAATTTIVAAPGASTQRQIKTISVVNKGAGSQNYTIQRNIAATARALTNAITLAPGEALEFLDGRGFVVKDALGGLKAGTLIDNTAFTDGTSQVFPAGYALDETAGTALTENDIAAARIDAKRSQVMVIEDETTRGQRATVTAGKALKVDGSAVTQPVSAASLPLPAGASTLAEQQTQTTSLQLLDDVVIADNAAFTDGTTKLDMAGFIFDETAGTALTENDAAAARVDSKRAIVVTLEDVTARGTRAAVTANGLAIQQSSAANLNATVTVVPAASNGLSMSHTVSAASTNATSLKASAGKVYAIQVFNLNTAPRYFKLYNKATAPTVGTDTPVKVIMIPGNVAGAGAIACEWTNGLDFTAGIAWALTTGMANADAGAVAATEILVEIDYK